VKQGGKTIRVETQVAQRTNRYINELKRTGKRMAKYDGRRADDVWMKQIWPLPADQKSNGRLQSRHPDWPKRHPHGHIDIVLDGRNMQPLVV
jgi:hypothetical protein